MLFNNNIFAEKSLFSTLFTFKISRNRSRLPSALIKYYVTVTSICLYSLIYYLIYKYFIFLDPVTCFFNIIYNLAPDYIFN